jgi:type IV pilus assembly protein PilQ
MSRLVLFLVLFYFTTKLYSQGDFNLLLLEMEAQIEEKSLSEIPSLNDLVNFDISNAPIQEFLGIMAESHELNISADPMLTILVTNRFSNARVRDVLLFLCRQNQLELTFLNNIISISKWKPAPTKPITSVEKQLEIEYDPLTNKVSLNLESDSLKLFTKQLTKKTGYNVIYNTDARDVRINAFSKNVSVMDALEQIALSNNLMLSNPKENFFIFEKMESKSRDSGKNLNNSKSRNESQSNSISVEVNKIGVDQFVTVSAYEAPIIDIIGEVASKAGKEYFLLSKPDGIISLTVKSLPFDAFLNYLLQASNYTYKEQSNIYIIGKRDIEGLRSSKIVKLKFRSVEEMDVYIPQSMKNGVQISVFKELNAIILSGSLPQITEIENFLRALDEPVPNVLIEVIVVDVRKGYNIQTGLNAFLGDSTNAPTSTGRVFPGIDVSIGTGAVNNLIEGLDKANIINLGKINPKFYATLKAMEDNNDIDIRSTPRLSTLNGHEATLKIGQSVYFVQQTQAINPGVNPITTVSQQFRQVEANTSILIKPLISGNEYVTLSIDAEFSNFIPPEFENAPPGNATRKFTSLIRIQNEEMIVLGGLEEISRSENNSGVPLLSRIPILKWIFSSKSTSKTKNRLVVFIKPTIVY